MAAVCLDGDGLPQLLIGTAPNKKESPVLHDPGNVCPSVSSGTTIVACCYAGGVVLGADTRTSAGAYVVNRAARKITKLTDRICVCRSGSAADTQAITQIARLQLQMFAQELPKHFEGQVPVQVASQLLQRLCFDYKDRVTAGLLVGGYDSLGKAQAFSIPIGGACFPVKYSAGGSGSVFITAFLDEHFREQMTKLEATELVRKAVAHAISRDGSSGGMIRIVNIDETGMQEVTIDTSQL